MPLPSREALLASTHEPGWIREVLRRNDPGRSRLRHRIFTDIRGGDRPLSPQEGALQPVSWWLHGAPGHRQTKPSLESAACTADPPICSAKHSSDNAQSRSGSKSFGDPLRALRPAVPSFLPPRHFPRSAPVGAVALHESLPTLRLSDRSCVLRGRKDLSNHCPHRHGTLPGPHGITLER